MGGAGQQRGRAAAPYRMTPKENTSAALPYSCPARRSGADHSGELISWLSCAAASPSRSARLRLKSASLASHLRAARAAGVGGAARCARRMAWGRGVGHAARGASAPAPILTSIRTGQWGLMNRVQWDPNRVQTGPSALVGDEQVVGGEVAVDDVLRVHERDAGRRLLGQLQARRPTAPQLPAEARLRPRRRLVLGQRAQARRGARPAGAPVRSRRGRGGAGCGRAGDGGAAAPGRRRAGMQAQHCPCAEACARGGGACGGGGAARRARAA